MYCQFIIDFIHLPAFLISGCHKDNDTWVFHLTPKQPESLCPCCGEKTVIHARSDRRLTHSRALNIPIDVSFTSLRRRCVSCGATHTPVYEGIPAAGKRTTAFQEWAVQACVGRTIQEASRQTGVPYTTLERWFYDGAAEQPAESDGTVICLDEFAIAKGHTYAFTAFDAKTKTVLNATNGRDSASIQALLTPIPEPAYVISDLAPAIRKAIQAAWPGAIHILDRFHVAQLFTEALSRRRKWLGRTGKHGNVRHDQRLLCAQTEELTAEEVAERQALLEKDPPLEGLWRAFTQMREAYASPNEETAKERLKAWFDCHQWSPISAVRSIAKTLVVRREALLSACWLPYSNGVMEGTNGKIKMIKRRGYGYRRLDHLLTRLRA